MRELTAVSIFICAFSSLCPAQQDSDTLTVTILHTNDVYGQIRRQMTGDGRRGGMAPCVHLIREIRRTRPTLVLEAGDAIAPGPLCAYDRGAAMVELLRLAGYDAMTPGNQEFTYGLDVLRQRRREAGFPFLAANLKGKEGVEVPVQGQLLAAVGGVPIGVFGLVSPEIATLADPKHVADLVLEDPLKAAAAAVKALRDRGAAYVIALVHMREGEAIALVRQVQGVDLVVAGGYRGLDRMSTVLTQIGLLNGVKVVTTPGAGFYVGRVRVSFLREPGGGFHVLGAQPDLIPVDGSVPDDPEAARRVAALEAAYMRAAGESLGRISGETLEAQARVVADLIRWRTDAEVGIVNRGGFEEIEEDTSLSLRGVDRFVRFDNELVTMKLTGRELRAIVKQSRRTENTGARLIFSGLDPKEMDVNGRPVQDEERYRVATVAFLAACGDGYRTFGGGTSVVHTGIFLQALVAEELRSREGLSPDTFRDRFRNGVWQSSWMLEGAFNRNYVDRTAEAYREQEEQVSFLSGNTSVAWNGAMQYALGYEVGRHVALLETRSEFGQVGSTFDDLGKSKDLLEADVTYRYRARNLKLDPFLSSGLSTAFTRTGERRPMLVRNSLGFQKRLFSALVVRFAGRGQRDFAAGENDYGAEVALDLEGGFAKEGKFRSEAKGFFGLTDRRVVSVENYNTLSFPLVGALHLAIRQSNFVYRVSRIQDRPVSGVAFRTDLTVGFVFGLDWKWL